LRGELFILRGRKGEKRSEKRILGKGGRPDRPEKRPSSAGVGRKGGGGGSSTSRERPMKVPLQGISQQREQDLEGEEVIINRVRPEERGSNVMRREKKELPT